MWCRHVSGALLGATIIISPSHASVAQTFVLGPAQFAEDKSGHGAVLCVWGFYLGIKDRTAVCNLKRTSSDDAIDRAIASIDRFIVANSSLKPTQTMLDDFKARETDRFRARIAKDGLQKTCSNGDLDVLRTSSPAEIDAGTADLLSVRREPVLNPCL